MAKLAHVLSTLDHGGVESLAIHLLDRLPARGLDGDVFHIGLERGSRRADFESRAVEFVACPYRPPRRLDFVRRLAAEFRRRRVERVLCYAFGNHALVAMAAAGAGVRRSFVAVQGSPLRDLRTRLKSLVLSHAARPFSTGEVACSAWVRDQLVRGLALPRDRVHVIPNAVDAAEIARRADAVRRPSDPLRPPVVVMVSRMDDAKDHPTLLRAVARLGSEGRPVRLRLAGDGPSRPAHEALARELGIDRTVEFLGARSDVPEVLGTADAAVLSTRTEGLPNALLEAMSAGTPAVATALPVCVEVLDGGRAGLLVPPRDPAALARAIERLVTDRPFARSLAEAARERVAACYDVVPTVDAYADLLGAD